MTTGDNAATASPKQRGRPWQRGQSGNPAGRPAGSRHRASLAAEALFDGEAEALTRKAVELALEGDTVALRLCLERVCPPRRDRPVSFALPPLLTAADAPKALAAIVQAVGNGDLTANEAADLAGLIEKYARAIEVSELAVRLAAIETQLETRK